MVLIHYSDGSIRPGWILSLAGTSLRIAVRNHEDSTVFKLAHGMWLSEQGEEVTFSFGLGVDDALELITHIGEMQTQPRPSTCAGGGDCVFRQLAHRPPS